MRIANALLAGFAAAILILAGYGLMAIADGAQVVQAKSSDPDCIEIVVPNATIRAWECTSPGGQMFLLNSVGFMVAEE